MVTIIDNFFDPWELKLVTEELKKLPFYSASDHPGMRDGSYIAKNTSYPGLRTHALIKAHPLLNHFIIRQIERSNIPHAIGSWNLMQFGHLKTEKDNLVFQTEKDDHSAGAPSTGDFIHKDASDWAYILYLSETNLESGTKLYPNLNTKKGESIPNPNDMEEDAFIKFKQNRIVILNASVPHMAWGSYGKDLSDGRLSIVGFARYME